MLCVIKSLAKALGYTLYDAIAMIMLEIMAERDSRLVEVALPLMDRVA